MSTFQEIVKAFNAFDLDADGVPEIESLQFLSFETPSEPVGTLQKFVIVLVEQRLLVTISGSRYSSADLLQRLQRFKGDLLAEGYEARFLEMRAYSGPIHQDGKTLLAIREFFKQVRGTFAGFSGAILVGSFPESMIVRTWPDWWSFTEPGEIKELGQTFPAGTKVYNIGRGIHAYRSEIVLSDLNGNWRNLYYQQHPSMSAGVFVPMAEQMLPDNKVLLTCATGNYAISQNSYQDFFWIKDDQWQVITRTPSEIQVVITLKLQDPELNAADRNQPNTITRPEICISRINAKNVATNPDKHLLDQHGKPRRCVVSTGVGTDFLYWLRDPNLERTLLIEYFDRNHAFRSGQYGSENMRVSKITYELGFYALNQGLDGINVPDKEREDISDASLLDVIRWLKKPLTIRGIGVHASDTASNFRNDPDYALLQTEAGGNPFRWIRKDGEYVPSFDGHYTADLHLFRTIWENGIIRDVCPSFFLHAGCDVNTPKAADVAPYCAADYGLGQNAECILFYANGLGVISRSKMFNDGPSGFGHGFGASDNATFGDGWVQHFQTESMDTNLAQKRTERKKSSFWSIIGDWTLRKFYLCEAKSAHFHLRYVYEPNESIPRVDKIILFNGETIGHCYANGGIDIFQDNTLYAVGNLPSAPLSVHIIAVWLEYFYRLFSHSPYATRHAEAKSTAEIIIGKGVSASVSVSGMPVLGIDAPATEQDIPGICLKVLLMLDLIRYKTWPEWIFPAFVSQVTAVQTPTQGSPEGYADFNSKLKPCQWMIAYDATWDAAGGRRILQVNINKTLHPHMVTTVFLKFDGRFMKDVTVVVSGQTNQGTTKDVQVPIQISPDQLYYYGSFHAHNLWRNNVGLKLKINGTRSWKNNVLKALIGDAMDSNPATIADVDENNRPTLRFLNTETGVDEKHNFTMGPASVYAPVLSLDPDEFDRVRTNNTFADATHVNLIIPDGPHEIGVTKKDEKTFENLNLHDGQDIDYFNVAFQCPAYDDSDEANRPRMAGANNYWGITHAHLPPILSCSVKPADLRCMDVDVYKGDVHNRALSASDMRSTGFMIDSPSRTLGAKQCYLVMRNHDSISQGAFRYALRISYSSAYDSIEINTHAPGYTEGTIALKRRFLDQLYERIDKPRPPDDREEIVRIDNVASFIKGFEKFLTDPMLIAALGQRKSKKACAAGLLYLGNLAEAFGRYDDSERLYRASATHFDAAHDRQGTLDSLENLKSQYERLGRTIELKKIKNQIDNHKKIMKEKRAPH